MAAIEEIRTEITKIKTEVEYGQQSTEILNPPVTVASTSQIQKETEVKPKRTIIASVKEIANIPDGIETVGTKSKKKSNKKKKDLENNSQTSIPNITSREKILAAAEIMSYLNPISLNKIPALPEPTVFQKKYVWKPPGSARKGNNQSVSDVFSRTKLNSTKPLNKNNDPIAKNIVKVALKSEKSVPMTVTHRIDSKSLVKPIISVSKLHVNGKSGNKDFPKPIKIGHYSKNYEDSEHSRPKHVANTRTITKAHSNKDFRLDQSACASERGKIEFHTLNNIEEYGLLEATKGSKMSKSSSRPTSATYSQGSITAEAIRETLSAIHLRNSKYAERSKSRTTTIHDDNVNENNAGNNGKKSGTKGKKKNKVKKSKSNLSVILGEFLQLQDQQVDEQHRHVYDLQQKLEEEVNGIIQQIELEKAIRGSASHGVLNSQSQCCCNTQTLTKFKNLLQKQKQVINLQIDLRKRYAVCPNTNKSACLVDAPLLNGYNAHFKMFAPFAREQNGRMVFHCSTCDVSSESELLFRLHLESPQHVVKAYKEIQQEMPQFNCQDCDAELKGTTKYFNHVTADKHSTHEFNGHVTADKHSTHEFNGQVPIGFKKFSQTQLKA